MTTPIISPLKEVMQEDNLSDECRDLLSTLPREKALHGSYIYRYEGFWFHSTILQGVLATQNHFKAQDTDTILATCPKSGTTWLMAMAFCLLNRSRFLDQDHHPLLTTNPQDLVPILELGVFGDRELLDLSVFPSPRLFGTHIPFQLLPRSTKDASCKIVYMCRNPKDTLVSLWHFVEKMRPKEWDAVKLEDVFDSFCNGMDPFGPFWDHVLGYWKESLENPRKVLFLKYEEVKEHPTDQLRKLAEFLKCPFSPEEEAKGTPDEISKLCSFDTLSNLKVNQTGRIGLGLPTEAFFRKGKTGDWKKDLTPEMAEKLDHIIDERTHDSGFKF